MRFENIFVVLILYGAWFVPNLYVFVFRLLQNKQITGNASSGIIISNQTLVLQQVTKHSSGYYRCAALNSEGESVSQSVKLDVKCEL